MSIEEIRGRLEAATPGPWERETSQIEDDGTQYTPARVWTDGGVDPWGEANNDYTLCWDVTDEDAEFIAHAPEDMRRLLNAVEAVLGLHKPRTEQVITGDCAEEACGHEESDDCPRTPFEACAACWSVAEEADAYFSEGGVAIVAYPCPAVEAITSALDPS